MTAASIKKREYTCCLTCNEVVSIPTLNPQEFAKCPRCHTLLRTQKKWSLTRCTFIACGILLLIPFALFSPLISLNLFGSPIDASVWSGIWKMATEDYAYTAFLVFLCAVFIPICFALLIIGLKIADVLQIKPRHILLTLGYVKPWVMLDVYLISLLVTMFKVRQYAELNVNFYIIAFVFITILVTLLFIHLNIKTLWEYFYPEQTLLSNFSPQENICCCSKCEYSFVLTHNVEKESSCPRCNTKINSPTQESLQAVWATLLTGIIMLFPANFLPISVVYVNGVATEDTLMSGVLGFISSGNYFIAFIVFTASIFVPISKVAIMLYLLICVHFNLRHSIKWEMRLLHFVHFIGRWSMLDLFVLALMMSLVTRGQIIDFSVGPAAFYFGIAVFLTMISSSLFDSRLIWKIYDNPTR